MADIPPLGSRGVTVVGPTPLPPDSLGEYGILGTGIGLLVLALRSLWLAYKEQADARVADHKEHSRDLMEVTRTIDKATDALTRERPDAGR